MSVWMCIFVACLSDVCFAVHLLGVLMCVLSRVGPDVCIVACRS